METNDLKFFPIVLCSRDNHAVRWKIEVNYVVNNGQDAASFDCGKAASEVEKIICGDDELSRLDESLNKAYLASA